MKEQDTVQGQTYLIPVVPFALEDFHEFCRHWGFVLRQKWEAEPDFPSYEECWELPNSDFTMSFVDDRIACLKFVTCRGDDVEGVANDFEYSYPIASKKQMLEIANSPADHNSSVDNIFRMSIAFDNFDPDAFLAFKNYALSTENPVLRKAALEGMARRAWPQSKELIESIAQNDTDEGVRNQALDVLSRWPGKD